MWAIWTSLSRLSPNTCQVWNSSLNTTMALLGLAAQFVLNSQYEIYRNQAWVDGTWETEVLGMPFLLICFGFVVCFFEGESEWKDSESAQTGNSLLPCQVRSGTERWRRYEVVQVEQGRSREKSGERLSCFPCSPCMHGMHGLGFGQLLDMQK